MSRRVIFKAAFLAPIAAAGFAVPAEAMTVFAEHAEAAVQYLDEVAIAAALLAVAVFFDTASWSFMTTRR